ncbi:hypothetical protein Tco_1504014, partial [Tanacetum coccineum]
VQTHRCIGHIDVEAQSIPKNIISSDPSHQGETFVKLVERHLSFEPIVKLLATIFDEVPEVGSLEKSMASKAKTDEPACIAPKGIIHLRADEPKEMSQRAWHQKAKLYLFADHSSKEKVRPDGRDVRMERTHEWKVRPDERDVRMEGTPEWKNLVPNDDVSYSNLGTINTTILGGKKDTPSTTLYFISAAGGDTHVLGPS